MKFSQPQFHLNGSFPVERRVFLIASSSCLSSLLSIKQAVAVKLHCAPSTELIRLCKVSASKVYFSVTSERACLCYTRCLKKFARIRRTQNPISGHIYLMCRGCFPCLFIDFLFLIVQDFILNPIWTGRGGREHNRPLEGF